MQNELIVRIGFRRYVWKNLPSFLLLAAFAGTITWIYHQEVSSVLSTLAFFAVAEPIVMLFAYHFRPTSLRFSGAKLYVTVRKQEMEVINLRQVDIELRQNASQKANDTCDIRLRDFRVNAYSQKNGASIIYGVQHCDAIRRYIHTYFLP